MAVRSGHFIRTRRIAAAALIACLFVCSGVRAQLLSAYFPSGVPGYATAPGVTVLSRARPDYDNRGARLNSFMLLPRLDEGLGYDSNVFGGSSGRGSWIVGTHP